MWDEMIQIGGVYRHFKGGHYRVIGVGKHTETGELLVFYTALYGEGLSYARPFVDFMSSVDRDKYPDADQIYRFALIKEA